MMAASKDSLGSTYGAETRVSGIVAESQNAYGSPESLYNAKSRDTMSGRKMTAE